VSDLVVVAMSGGVDSSVAAVLLKEQGYRVVGVTLNLLPRTDLVTADTRQNACCSLEAVEDARRVADRIGIPHYTLNFREIFEQAVVSDFLQEYLRGRTPNPCIRCNKHVKFGALLSVARSLGARFLATGHYARISQALSGRYVLSRAVDRSKDQSYALYSLTQEQLAHTLFPLGGLEKSDTRRIALEIGLVTAGKPDSQEICFVPDGDYAGFIRDRDSRAVHPGPILDEDGRRIGTHPGVAFFTVGQRKGLGVATGRPMYVLRIEAERNAIVVGEREGLYSGGLLAEDVTWVSMEATSEPFRVAVQIRYRAPEVPATARLMDGGLLSVSFDEPQRAVSPGQAVVLYKGDDVVAGGTIVESYRERVDGRAALAVSR